MEHLKLIEVRSEIGAGTRGASLGIDAVKLAAINAKSTLFSSLPPLKVQDQNDLLFQPNDHPRAIRIPGIVAVYEQVMQAVADTVQANRFPVILAADHASAGGTIAGLKKTFPNERLGVIWIDAHADLHSPYTTPSGNVHGMPLATALAEDNRECQRGEVQAATAELWDQLKNTGGVAPKIQPEDVFFIGLRDVEEEEWSIINRHNMPNRTVAEVREQGPAHIARQALEHLAYCDRIYISFDVDSMDPEAVSQGTGTPVPNGLFEAEATALLCAMVQSPKVACFELVEVNPLLDNKVNAMGEAAFRIFNEVIQNINHPQ